MCTIKRLDFKHQVTFSQLPSAAFSSCEYHLTVSCWWSSYSVQLGGKLTTNHLLPSVMLLPLIALLMSKKCFSDATSDSDANDVGNSGSFSWRIFFIRLYVLPTTESGHGHNFACLPIYLSLPICLLDPCVIFSILKPNQRPRCLVHPPTTEWKALYGELAPLKAITACDIK